jgi:hypothetical protein
MLAKEPRMLYDDPDMKALFRRLFLRRKAEPHNSMFCLYLARYNASRRVK